MQKPLRTLASAAVISVLTTHVAHAAGFALYGEGAGYTAGNYAAGAAAEAADASTGYYNPAGLALIRDKQVVFGGTGVFPETKINGTSTFTTAVPGLGDIPYEQNFNDLDGGYNGFIPVGHFALPVGDHTTIGLSMTSPYGLATDWAPASPVRYAATFTELLTVNISPEIGSQVLENLAVGAGLDFQYSRVKFNQMIGAPAILDAISENPSALDTFSQNKGSSWGIGFHAGLMGLFNDNHTRIGLNYQSRVRHTFYGHSELNGPFANEFDIFDGIIPPTGTWKNDDLFSNPIEFPDVVTLSGYHDVNERLALLGSVVYTGWNVFKTIQLNNIAAPHVNQTPDLDYLVEKADIVNAVAENFHDSWRVAIGANYRFNPKWMLRVGAGYDQTPTNNTDRNIRLPDVDRWALAIGGHYQMKHNIGFDLGYTHLFAGGTATIHSTQPLETSTYRVDSNSGHFSADLVGAQVVWAIDKVDNAPMK